MMKRKNVFYFSFFIEIFKRKWLFFFLMYVEKYL